MAGTGAVSLLPVRQAVSRILANVTPVETERVDLAAAHGRTLAEPIAAPRDQPPFPSSAMDGYAVRATDSADPSDAFSIAGLFVDSIASDC